MTETFRPTASLVNEPPDAEARVRAPGEAVAGNDAVTGAKPPSVGPGTVVAYVPPTITRVPWIATSLKPDHAMPGWSISRAPVPLKVVSSRPAG